MQNRQENSVQISRSVNSLPSFLSTALTILMKRPYSDYNDPTYMSSYGGKRPALSRSTKKIIIKNFQSEEASGLSSYYPPHFRSI